MAALECKLKEDDKGKSIYEETKRLETTTNIILNCDICIKDFKSKSIIQIHDKKYHLVKGRNIDKCDNCNEKLDDKGNMS